MNLIGWQFDYLSFLFALSFFFIAIISFTFYQEIGSHNKDSWKWFSVFSGVLFVHQLYHIYPSSSGLVWALRMIVLAVAYYFLGLQIRSSSVRSLAGPCKWGFISVIAGTVLIVFFGDVQKAHLFFNIVACLPLGLLSGYVFFKEARSEQGASFNSLMSASISMAILGLLLPSFNAIFTGGHVFLVVLGIVTSSVLSFSLLYYMDLKKTSDMSGWLDIKKYSNSAVVIVIVSIEIAGLFLTNAIGEYAYRISSEVAQNHLNQITQNVDYRIDTANSMVKALSGSPYVIPILIDKSTANLNKANSVLDRYQQAMKVSICYLMDTQGNVLASSNRSYPDSLVGKNYSFRPYFKIAETGISGSFIGEGVTTGKKGYYVSYPVKDAGGVVRGIVVAKINLDQGIFGNEYMAFLKVDGYREIFVSNPRFEKKFGSASIENNLGPDKHEEFISPGGRYLQKYLRLNNAPAEIGLMYPLVVVGYLRFFGIFITFLFVLIASLANYFIRKQNYYNARLEESEMTYRAIVENTHDAVFIYAGNRFLFVNDQFSRIIGYERADALKMGPLDFIHPEEKEKVKSNIMKRMKGEYVPDRYESRVVTKAGKTIICEFAARVIDYKGIKAVLGTAQDITERKANEDQLKKSREFLRALIEEIPIPVFYKDTNGVYAGFNKAFTDLLDITPEDLIGKKPTDIYKDKKLAKAYEEIDVALLKKTGKQVYESVIRKVSGEQRNCIFYKATFNDPDGSIGGLIGAILDITDRKKMEQSLKESEQWLDKSLMSIGDGVISCDSEGKVAFMNPVAEYLTGWERHQAANVPIWQVMNLVNEATGQPVANPANIALKEGGAVELANHTILISKDGRRIPIDDSAAPIKGSDGKILGAILVFRDVTSRRESDRKIRQLSSAVESSSASIVITDTDGNIQYVNPKFCDLTGYSYDESIGQNPRILKSGVQTSEFYKGLWDKIKSGDVWHGEFLNKKKNAELYWESASISPIKDQDGKIINFVAVKEDITDRKKVERELFDSKNFLDRIINSIADPIFVKDSRHRWVLLNDAFCKFFGRSREELMGKSDYDFFPKEEADVFWKKDEEVFGTKHGNENEESFTDSSGATHTIITKKVFSEWKSGEPYLVGIITDITERKKIQDELLNSKQRLETTIDAIPDIMFEVGLSGIIYDVHTQNPQDLVLSRDELLGKTLSEFLPMEAADICMLALKDANGKGRSNGMQYSLGLPQGQRWFELSISKKAGSSEREPIFIALARDITERKKAEEQVKLNESRLNILVDILQYSGDSLQDFLDFSLEQAIRLTDSKIGYLYFYDEDKKEFTLNSWSKDVMKECTINEKQTTYQLDKTGIWGEAVRQRKPILLNDFHAPHPLKKGYPEGHAPLKRFLTIPVVNAGKIVAVVGVANKQAEYGDQDIFQLNLLMEAVWKIVERKRIEVDKENLNIMLKSIVEAIPERVFWKNKQGVYLGSNTSFAKDAGMPTAEALVGKTDADLSWGKNAEQYLIDDRKVIDTGIPKEHYEEPMTISSSGEVLSWVLTSKVPLKDVSGNITGILGAYHDITDKKKSEQRLITLNSMVFEIMEHNDLQEVYDIIQEKSVQITESAFGFLGMKMEDGNMQIVSMTKPAWQECQMDHEHLIFKQLDNLFGEVLLKGNTILTNDPMGHPSSKGSLPQGHPFVRNFLGVPIKYRGEIIGCICLANKKEDFLGDDREIMQTFASAVGGALAVIKDETQLKKKNSELEELYKVKSDFTSMVSHELRTPLTSIKEGISIVLDGTAGRVNDEQKDFLEIARRNVDRLHRLINDVLDFSKLESQKMTFNMKQGDLSKLLKDVVSSYKPVCESKGLSLNIVLGKALPEVSFDEDRISQVINNIINNAIKFTVSGGITVEASFDKRMSSLLVCISDTGPGIKPESIDHLFEKFVQLGGPSDRKTGGTGLGLAISREIITAHHGKIWVESEFGKGSRFCFSLPVSKGS